MRGWWLAIPVLLVTACSSDTTGVGPAVATPTNLSYTVEPSGTPGQPTGILLTWDFDDSPDLQVWNVYSRASTNDAFGLRGSTTSNSFHDAGVPHLQYYVTAVDNAGLETDPSNAITVDERLALEQPATLTSTSLDGAIALTWSDNAFQDEPNAFKTYRVYSASYDLDNDLCGTDWSLEGTTVSPEFVSGALQNGIPRCFGVSAVSVEGYESLWSPLRADTPRPDSRNVLLNVRQVTDAGSGFTFWRDLNSDGAVEPNELGLVGPGSDPAADFSIESDGSGRLFLTPVNPGTTVALYGSAPVEDLTSIDIAPETGFAAGGLEAKPGWGYVFQMSAADGFARFGAVRVTHVGQNFLILDWSYQTDPGNPELLVGGGVRTRGNSGVTVAR